jgi:putative ABC transport system permease protein
MFISRYFRRRRRDEELTREMEHHLALETDLNIARGMDSNDARREAHLKFGSRNQVRERLWNRNSIVILDNTLRDIRYACRTLLRSPGYTLMAIVTLGLGIGANTAIFTVINGVLLRPLPYAHPAQIVRLKQTASRIGPDSIGFSVQEVADYRDQSHSFSDLAEYHSAWWEDSGARCDRRSFGKLLRRSWCKAGAGTPDYSSR